MHDHTCCKIKEREREDGAACTNVIGLMKEMAESKITWTGAGKRVHR